MLGKNTTERQSNTTQLAQGSYFQRKKTASGGTRTHDHSLASHTLLNVFLLCCLLSEHFLDDLSHVHVLYAKFNLFIRFVMLWLRCLSFFVYVS